MRTRINKKKLKFAAALKVGDNVEHSVLHIPGTITAVLKAPQDHFLTGERSHDSSLHESCVLDVYGQFSIEWDDRAPRSLTQRTSTSGQYLKNTTSSSSG